MWTHFHQVIRDVPCNWWVYCLRSGRIHGNPAYKEISNAYHKNLLYHCASPRSAPSLLPLKLGGGGTSNCQKYDNKQLLSFEIWPYSWTTLIFSLTCSGEKPSWRGLSPPSTTTSTPPPPAQPPLLLQLWCAASRGSSGAKLLFLQLWELEPLVVGGQASSCPHDRVALGRVKGIQWGNSLSYSNALFHIICKYL